MGVKTIIGAPPIIVRVRAETLNWEPADVALSVGHATCYPEGPSILLTFRTPKPVEVSVPLSAARALRDRLNEMLKP